MGENLSNLRFAAPENKYSTFKMTWGPNAIVWRRTTWFWLAKYLKLRNLIGWYKASFVLENKTLMWVAVTWQHKNWNNHISNYLQHRRKHTRTNAMGQRFAISKFSFVRETFAVVKVFPKQPRYLEQTAIACPPNVSHALNWKGHWRPCP